MNAPAIISVQHLPTRSRRIPTPTRRKLLAANCCAYCGSGVGPFEIDHVFAFSRGGSNEPHNLTLACRACNRSKGAGPAFLTPQDALRAGAAAAERKKRRIEQRLRALLEADRLDELYQAVVGALPLPPAPTPTKEKAA